jgi:spermidine synthase
MSTGVFRQVGLFSQSTPAELLKRAVSHQLKEVFYEEGLVSTVAVLRDPHVYGRLGKDSVPHFYLVVNGKVDASSTGDMPTQVLSAQIPLLLHPDPRRVLVVGLASGTTAGSALRHPIERLDVVELEPAVVRASRAFDFVNGHPLDDRRTHVVVGDGRTFLELPGSSWDVIISEPSNPWMTGTANLFTLEYFRLVRSRLTQSGVYAQWFQMYGMSPQNLETLVRTFARVFPRAYLFQTIPFRDLLLVGTSVVSPIELDAIESRMQQPSIQVDLARVGILSLESLLARGRWGPAELRRIAATAGPVNTDDNARIEFTAPRDFYRETTGGNERFLESMARGLGPYLTARDIAARPGLLARLSRSYDDLTFYAEKSWIESAGR